MSHNGEILNSDVLVLNQAYEPLDICRVRRAVVMVLLKKAEMVRKREQNIRTVTDKYPAPSVIRIKRYINPHRDSIILNKKNIFRRDNHTCQYCGKKSKNLTIDHIVPKVKGGKDSWTNLVAACQECNNEKGDKDLSEIDLTLNKEPRKPSHIHRLRKYAGNKSRKEWRPFLFFE